jgi:hypothetical protein
VLAAAAAIATAMLAGMPLVWAIASICARRDAFWARYSHAALVTGYAADGGVLLTEALAHGVVQRRFAYVEGDYKHIPVRMSEEDRREVVAFARSVVQAKAKYGFVLFATLAVYCLTTSLPGPTLLLSQSGTAICSGFVSDALTRTDIIWPREPYWQMPADIAEYFHVT